MQFEQSIYRTYDFYRSLPLDILNELWASDYYTSRLSDTEREDLIDAIVSRIEDSMLGSYLDGIGYYEEDLDYAI